MTSLFTAGCIVYRLNFSGKMNMLMNFLVRIRMSAPFLSCTVRQEMIYNYYLHFIIAPLRYVFFYLYRHLNLNSERIEKYHLYLLRLCHSQFTFSDTRNNRLNHENKIKKKNWWKYANFKPLLEIVCTLEIVNMNKHKERSINNFSDSQW